LAQAILAEAVARRRRGATQGFEVFFAIASNMAPKSGVVVHSTAGKFEVLPPSAKTILGEYAEDGSNHGRKVFKRVAEKKHQQEIVLFFWDARDGKELSGWWFGNKVGGGQVWARCPEMAEEPPKKGWKCPVDGLAQKNVVVSYKSASRYSDDYRGGSGQRNSYQQGVKRGHVEEEEEEEAEQTNGAGATSRGARESQAKAATVLKEDAQPLLVSLKNTKEDAKTPPAIRKLLGEYQPTRELNHGRRCYSREREEGEGEAIFLYYWDQRDGWNFSGWWFANSVGGTGVLARCQMHDMHPPVSGWRVPHDDRQARHDFQVKPKGFSEDEDMPEAERVEQATEAVTSTQKKAEAALEMTRSVLVSECEVLEEAVKAATEMLEAQHKALVKVQASIARHTKAGKERKALSSEMEAELSVLEERTQSTKVAVEAELQKAWHRVAEFEKAGAEERDTRSLEVALPLVMEIVAAAELQAEAAATDEAAAKAEAALNNASKKVAAAEAQAKKYAPEAKKAALGEYELLQKRCGGAQKRLAVWAGGASKLEGVDSVTAMDMDTDLAVVDMEDEDDLGRDDVQDDDDVEDDIDLRENERIGRSTSRVEEEELRVSRALETVQAMLREDSGGVDELVCRQVMDLIRAQDASLRRCSRVLERDAGACPKAKALKSLKPRVEVLRKRIFSSFSRAKTALSQAKKSSRQNDGLAAMDQALPSVLAALIEAEEAVDAVELDVGEAQCRQAQVEMGDDFASQYETSVNQAIAETEVAVGQAQRLILAARQKIDKQLQAARQLDGETKKTAFSEVAPLRSRLVAAHQKLKPFARARQEYQHRLDAAKSLQEAAEALASCEAEVEEAHQEAKRGSCEAAIEAIEVNVPPFQISLTKALELVERKMSGSDATLKENISRLQTRGQEVQSKLDELRYLLCEQRQRVAGTSLLNMALEDTLKAEAHGQKMDEAEAPWLTGGPNGEGREVLPEAETENAIAACEEAMRGAEPVIETVRLNFAERQVDLRQLPEGAARSESSDELLRLETRVDAVAVKVTQLKVDTFARRTKLQLGDVIERLVAAEAAVKKTGQAAKPLEQADSAKLTSKLIQKTCADILASEGAAAQACQKAREAVVAKRRETKFTTSPSFRTQLSKLEARLDLIQNDLLVLKNEAKAGEEAKQSVKAQRDSVAKLATEVDRVELLTLPMGDERPGDEAEERMAHAIAKAQEAVTALVQKAEASVAGRNGRIMKAGAPWILEQAEPLQLKLNEMRTSTKERCHGALSRTVLRGCQEKVDAAEDKLRKADEAEAPFLKGIEASSTAETRKIIAKCEVAAAAAQHSVDEARVALKAIMGEVRMVHDTSGDKSASEELAKLKRRLEKTAEKLSQYFSDTEERKSVSRR